MKPLKIAIFTPTFLPKCSGAEIFHHNLSSELCARGHEPIIILPKRMRGRLLDSSWKLPYKSLPYPANTWSYFKYWPAFALWLNRRILSGLQQAERFDVWHTVVLSPSGVCFSNWQQKSGVPGLVRAVGDDVPNGPTSQADRLVRQWIPEAQAVVSLSAEMSAGLARLGVRPNRVEEIPNAVDHTRFSAALDRRALREKLGVPPDAFLFVCVARNHPQKDLRTLLKAFGGLKTKSTVHLAIAGRGVPQLAAEVAAMGLGDRVHLLEFRPSDGPTLQFPPQDLVDLYRSGDAFVLSSILEGFSSALLEAMAAELPVVATDVPGIQERVRHEHDALLSPGGNAEALAAGLRRLINDPELRQRLGEQARRTSMAFGWEATTSRYLDLYERLILERNRAGGHTVRE